MYEKNDKRRIYYLLDSYLSGNINEPVFCDEFYYSYDRELDHSTLTEEERKAFRELGEVSDRFSEFDEDFKNYPGVFYTKEELRQKIIKTKEALKNVFEELKNTDEISGDLNV